MTRAAAWLGALLGCTVVPQLALAAPFVTWLSEPAGPGDVVLVYGGDLAHVREVSTCRLPDGEPGMPRAATRAPECTAPLRAATLQPSDQSLKFELPAGPAGIFALDVGGARRVLGAPRVDWVQMVPLAPDVGVNEASPGSTLQIIGRNFAPDASASEKLRVALRAADGSVTSASLASADKYSLNATLPATLAAGTYTLWVHNGFGGTAGWAGGLTLRIRAPSRWPDRVFNVREFGARGDNVTDDSDALRRALDAAAKNSGGVVYLPAGTYRVTGTFRLPRRVTLRGESKDATWLKWPQTSPRSPADFVPSVLTGGGDYAIEQLSLMVRNAKVVLHDDGFEDVALQRPTEGADPDPEHGRNVFLRSVGFHHLPYSGRPSATPERDAQWPFARWGLTPLPDAELTVALGGIRTLEVTDCDFFGTQRFLDVRNARFAGNKFSNPMNSAWTDLGGQHIVFEHNDVEGASSFRTCTLPLRHFYTAYNTTRNIGRGERETLTLDLGAPPAIRRKASGRTDPWSARVAAVRGRELRFSGARLATNAYRGFDALIVSGRGAGQYRPVAENTAQAIRVARDWDVAPDASSVVLLQRIMGHCIHYRNRGDDVSVFLQIWGAVYDCTFDGNVTRRSGGIWGLGGWFIQWLGNRVEHAVTFHSGIGPAGPTPEGTAEYGFIGFTIPTGPWTNLGRYPYVLGSVMRGNQLSYGHRILAMWGYGGTRKQLDFDAARDIVIDRNAIDHTPVGIELDANVAGAVVTHNTLLDVAEPLRLHAPDKVSIIAAPSAVAGPE